MEAVTVRLGSHDVHGRSMSWNESAPGARSPIGGWLLERIEARSVRLIRIIAWALVIGHVPVWAFAITVTPFLPLPAAQRVAVATGSVVVAEVMFYVGGVILGAAVIARFRRPRVRTGRSFAGKRVAVLGATGSLGAAIAHALKREGAELVSLARDTTCLDDALRDGALQVEITSPDSLEAVAGHLGAIDMLVCATGMDVRKDLAAHSAEEIAAEVEVNLVGPVLATRALLHLVGDGGTIAILGGFADGRLALPYHSVDVASRAGVAAFCESMNRELPLEGRDVRLCYLCPGPADTEGERPYGELWRSMGSPPVPPERAADFVLAALVRRRRVAVMGRSNRLMAWINKVSPGAADVLGIRRAGRRLRDAFSSARSGPTP